MPSKKQYQKAKKEGKLDTQKEYNKKWNRENKEKCVSYSLKYYFTNKDGKVKDYRKRTIDNIRETQKRSYQTNKEKIIAKKQKATKEFRLKFPEKYKAQNLSKKIVIKGKCQICKSRLATDRHHSDYTKPLKVILCCKPCHYKLDEKRRANE